MRKWLLVKKNKFLMNRLMHIYSRLLTGIILLTMAALCVFTAKNNTYQTKENMKNLENKMTSYVLDKKNTVSFLYMELASSNDTIDNLRNFLKLNPSEYFDYTQRDWEVYHKDTRISNTVGSLFNAFPDLIELYVKLDGSTSYLRGNRRSYALKETNQDRELKEGFLLKRPILNQDNSQTIGELVAVFSDEKVLENQRTMMEKNKMDAFIFDAANQEVFGYNHSLTKNQKKELLNHFEKNEEIPSSIEKDYLVKESTVSPGNHTFLLLASKKSIRKKNWQMFRVILLVGVSLTLALLYTLHRTFKRYFRQVEEIVSITQSVAKGNLEERIDLNQVEDELYDLSAAINFMIGSMDQYIRENYELEIKQRDAHMEALQSQINPHFLYNTLEYIRMYALSKNQKELAKVVYAFSALLRNNTTQEKTTTLEKELSFCEKYVYLYQMRYPDRVAYFFQIDPKLENLEIPKFCIQPLVENYFVHGIDYTQNSNAISVKAYLEKDDIYILITDNGKGMTKEKLNTLNESLLQVEDEAGSSIGVRNVYFRLKHFFKEQLEMTITSKENKGTKILIKVMEGGKSLV